MAPHVSTARTDLRENVEVKHATKETLAMLGPLLDGVRTIPGLTEKAPGIFYRRSSAFLHFHEDPAGIFADIKTGTHWERMAVNTERERSTLLRIARRTLR